MKQPRLALIGNMLHSFRRRSRNVRFLLTAITIMVVAGAPAVYYGFTYMRSCSTSQTADFIKDLCAVYDRGEVAGNMCEKLCHENQFTFQGCSNTYSGKTVAMMRCRDCGRRQRHGDRSATVVFKTKIKFMDDNWRADNNIHFRPEETTLRMVNKTIVAVRRRMSGDKFQTDLSNQSDVLSYIWRQPFQVDATGDGDRDMKYAKAALQSIYSLAIQEEYGIVVTYKAKNASYVPGLYGTCGPAYFMEYTPSFSALGYVLFDRKEFGEFASLVPETVPWADRAKAALQLLNIVQHLESVSPPVFFCGLKSHNFGLNDEGDVTILDLDSFKYGEVNPPGKPCTTDRKCNDDRCFGRCNLTTNTCSPRPVYSNLQNTCRYIFSSPIPALQLGLLRTPPSSVTTELNQLLQECANPDSLRPLPWKSDETMINKLFALVLMDSLHVLEHQLLDSLIWLDDNSDVLVSAAKVLKNACSTRSRASEPVIYCKESTSGSVTFNYTLK